MFTNLWLLNLYFLANILITLSFITYAWIYIDAFLAQRKTKDIIKSTGAILLALYFVINILTFNTGLNGVGLTVALSCFSLGLFMIFLGNMQEAVPDLPEKKAVKTSLFNIFIYIIPFVAVALIIFFNTQFFTGVIFSVLVAAQNFRKVIIGKSKEYRPLSLFWTLITIFSVIQLASMLGKYYFNAVDVYTREYSPVWIINQLIVIVAAILMFRWIARFISFRIVARIFLYIWQIAIFLTVVIASTYSLLVINSAESQIQDLLTKNANLILFNLGQIQSNNRDILTLVAQNKDLITGITSKDAAKVQDQIEGFIKNNSYIDKVQVLTETASLIYDSENPTIDEASLADSTIIKKTIEDKKPYSAFTVEDSGIDSKNINYQFTFPITKDDGTLIGVIITTKRMNNNYLDYLKQQAQQELIVYVNDKRAASTILDSDGQSRLQNLPLVLDSELSKDTAIPFQKGRILSTPYYFAFINLEDVNANSVGKLVIATKQSVLANVAQGSMFNLFALSLILTLVTTGPSYILAKNLSKDISA